MAQFVIDNWESISTIIILILGIVKATKWGADKAKALNLVVDTIEATKNDSAKASIKQAVSAAELPQGAKDAIETSVLKADASKPDPVAWKVLLREFLRGVIKVSNVT